MSYFLLTPKTATFILENLTKDQHFLSKDHFLMQTICSARKENRGKEKKKKRAWPQFAARKRPVFGFSPKGGALINFLNSDLV